MLEQFRAAQTPRIQALLRAEQEGRFPPPLPGPRPPFAAALRRPDGPAVIAEYKRASPSKGVINLGLTPEGAAAGYAAAGAAALSVLTEEAHFQGSLDFLARMAGPGLPLLRKDFLLHPAQVAETLSTPASAALVIVRMFARDRDLSDMVAACARAGLDAVVEVFDETDLDRAKAVGASLLQVNNRDLDKLTTNLDISRRLIGRKASGETWISASGIDRAAQLRELSKLGFDAVLVGTSLMARPDPGAALAALLHGGAA